MEPIELTLYGNSYTLLPMPNGTFTVFNSSNDLLGSIKPVLLDNTLIEWKSVELADEFAQALGEALENAED